MKSRLYVLTYTAIRYLVRFDALKGIAGPWLPLSPPHSSAGSCLLQGLGAIWTDHTTLSLILLLIAIYGHITLDSTPSPRRSRGGSLALRPTHPSGTTTMQISLLTSIVVRFQAGHC